MSFEMDPLSNAEQQNSSDINNSVWRDAIECIGSAITVILLLGCIASFFTGIVGTAINNRRIADIGLAGMGIGLGAFLVGGIFTLFYAVFKGDQSKSI